MRAFFDAHEGGLAANVIPAAGFLLQGSSIAKDFNLAWNLKNQGPTNSGDRVQVFDLDLGAVFVGSDRTNGDIHIAAELAFLHVGVTDAAVDHHLLEDGQIREGFLWSGNVGFADDFHKWGSGAVEVDAGCRFHVETLGHIFFEMDANEVHVFIRCADGFLSVLRISEIMEGDDAAEAERHIILADLVVLRHVGVEIIFPVEFADRADFASEHQAGERGELESLLVHHRQGAGHAHADWTNIGIRLGSIFHGAGTKHFAARLELHVNLEADGGDVISHGLDLEVVGL